MKLINLNIINSSGNTVLIREKTNAAIKRLFYIGSPGIIIGFSVYNLFGDYLLSEGVRPFLVLGASIIQLIIVYSTKPSNSHISSFLCSVLVGLFLGLFFLGILDDDVALVSIFLSICCLIVLVIGTSIKNNFENRIVSLILFSTCIVLTFYFYYDVISKSLILSMFFPFFLGLFLVSKLFSEKFFQATVVLDCKEPILRFYDNQSFEKKVGEISVKNISKFEVVELPNELAHYRFTFKTVLKNRKEKFIEKDKFWFDHESELIKMLQLMAKYAKVPAYDSKGKEIAPISSVI